MKFIRSEKVAKPGQALVFHLTEREKELLLATLQLFPVLPADYHQLSRDPKDARPAEQEWLVEVMTQQRQQHKKRVQKLFAEESRFFKEDGENIYLSLTAEQMEWLLSVLNEIRVGSWVQLGRPELEDARRLKPTPKTSRQIAAMELSGYFQSVLLEAYS